MAADQSAEYTFSPVGISSPILFWLIGCWLTVLPFHLPAQKAGPEIMAELEHMISESYGPDQELINGIEYFNLHIHSSGHKFLDEDKYYEGWVAIDNKLYNHVLLKYNLFNQQVLLLIDHPQGGNKQIILNNLRINGFMINGRVFRKYSFPGYPTRFYQVIGDDGMACLYHFRKQEIPRATDQNNLSEFTEVDKKSYLHWRSELHAFKGNRSFVRIFHDHQGQITSMIRQNKLKVRKLSDTQMHWLINFCHSLTENPVEDQ